MISREQYLDWLRALQDQKLIKVITGVRRSGKSTLLELFRADLKARGVKTAQIQAYNFEDEEISSLRDYHELHRHIVSKLTPTAMNYIFLDEIQKVEHFEEAVSSLAAKENVDVYITGSNAYLLSGELATYLTGRYISIHMLPFSFAEYAQAFPDAYPRDLLDTYLRTSSFPEAVNIAVHTPRLVPHYLDDLYTTIINNDIATRYQLPNRDVFEKVLRFVLSAVGSPISASNISNYLRSQHNPVHHSTVTQYLQALCDCFVLYPVNRYDIRGKNLLSSNAKYYVVDLGLRDHLLGSPAQSDRGHRLENTVFLELLRRNEGRVWIGKQDADEVDFVVQKYDGSREYYQVAYTVASPETFEREINPLRRIRDNYPKTILTADSFNEDFSGIKKVNVVDWLMGK